MKKKLFYETLRSFSFVSNDYEKTNGSSETIRETTFQFELFLQHLPEQKVKISHHFLEWFIGFAEGDGSFIVSRPKLGRARLFFTLVQKEVRVLHRLRSELGFGKVQRHGKYFRYVVSDQKGIDRLIHLFNGNLVLNKTRKRFLLWLDSRNTLKDPDEKIVLKPAIKITNFLSSGWLCGFVDAEGCFHVSFQKDERYSLGFRVRCYFILDQKDEFCILDKIRKDIGSGLVSLRGRGNYFRYVLQDMSFLDCLMKYLKKYPLRTHKNISKVRLERIMRYRRTRNKIPWKGKVLKRVLRLVRYLEEKSS